MKLFHMTGFWNVESILRTGLLIERSRWGGYVYLTTDINRCLEIYPHLEGQLLEVLEVEVDDEKDLHVDPLHPDSKPIVGYAYTKDIPPDRIKVREG